MFHFSVGDSFHGSFCTNWHVDWCGDITMGECHGCGSGFVECFEDVEEKRFWHWIWLDFFVRELG